MKRATLEILQDGEQVFGSNTQGKYFVQVFEDDRPLGGQFFKTIQEAERLLVQFETAGTSNPQLLNE